MAINENDLDARKYEPRQRELREERARLLAEMDRVLDTVKREKRDLRADEQGTLAGIKDRVEAIDKEKAPIDEQMSYIMGRMVYGGQGFRDNPIPTDPKERERYFQQLRNRAQTEATGPTFRTKDGKEIRAARHGERVAPVYDGPANPIGRFVREALTGSVDHELRDFMNTFTNYSGGYLVPEVLSQSIIDKARGLMLTLQAGALTLPMPEGPNLTIAAVDSDPTPQWKGELATFSETGPLFRAINMSANTVGMIVPVSVELLEDGINFAATLEGIMANVVAHEIDRVMLEGAGSSGEPTGILTWSGVTEMTAVGTPTWQTMLNIRAALLAANVRAENISYFYSPLTDTALNSQRENSDGSGPYLQPPKALADARTYVTTQVAGSDPEDETRIYAGDFSNQLLGVRTAPKIEIFRAGDSNVSKLAATVRIYTRVDTAILRPDHFVRALGVTGIED